MGSAQSIKEIIDNDNGRFQRNNSMTMSMKKIYGIREKRLDESEVDGRVDVLLEHFPGSEKSRPQYCDFVRYLTDRFLEEAIEVANQPNIVNHGGYFGTMCRNQLYKAHIYPRKRRCSFGQ